MGRDREFDEVLRRKISETLDEPIDESVDADDLMFDLGMRYLRMKAAEKKAKITKKAHQLSLWVKDAASKTALVEYVDTVTDCYSPDYIPPSDRIAVFDLDGTLFCELDPTWFYFMLFKYRIQEDPSIDFLISFVTVCMVNTPKSCRRSIRAGWNCWGFPPRGLPTRTPERPRAATRRAPPANRRPRRAAGRGRRA